MSNTAESPHFVLVTRAWLDDGRVRGRVLIDGPEEDLKSVAFADKDSAIQILRAWLDEIAPE